MGLQVLIYLGVWVVIYYRFDCFCWLGCCVSLLFTILVGLVGLASEVCYDPLFTFLFWLYFG